MIEYLSKRCWLEIRFIIQTFRGFPSLTFVNANVKHYNAGFVNGVQLEFKWTSPFFGFVLASCNVGLILPFISANEEIVFESDVSTNEVFFVYDVE